MNCNLCFEDFIRGRAICLLVVMSQDWSRVTVSRVLHENQGNWSGEPANTPGTWATGPANQRPVFRSRDQYGPIRGPGQVVIDQSEARECRELITASAPICLWSAQPPGHEWNFDKISGLILTCRLSSGITSSKLETI